MTDFPASLVASLTDRYRLERELGQRGMARRRVAEATARLVSLKRPGFRFRGHCNDLRRVAASAAEARAHPDA